MTGAKRFSIRMVGLAGFFVAALVVVGIFFGPRLFEAPKETPRGSYPLGKMTVGEELVHEFLIPNPFGESLTLASVQSSNPDAKVLSFDKTLPGHGQGIVRIGIHPTEPGPLQAQFSLTYGGERRGLRSVALHGEVVPPALPEPKTASRPELLMEASELLGLTEIKNAETPVVVDLRSPEDYQRSRLPRSLNMSSTQLKASAHLKSKPLVIVDEGSASVSALEIAEKMQTAGFVSVRVLKGGIAGWLALGAPTAGPDRDLPAPISSQAVLNGLAREGWRVVDARTSEKPLPFTAAPAAVTMASLSKDSGLENFRHSLKPGDRVLIVTDTGSGREQMGEITGKLSGFPVYFARGGAAGINHEYVRIVQAASKSVVARVDATATVSNKRITRSLGGCSSCR